jgi:hypothetical protein
MRNESERRQDKWGLHMHGILLVPRQSRLGVTAHFNRHENRYIRHNLLRLNVQPIESNPQEVVGYVFKSLKNRLFTCDDILIVSKDDTELRERSNG